MADEIHNGWKRGADQLGFLKALRGGIELDGLPNTQPVGIEPGDDRREVLVDVMLPARTVRAAEP